MRIWQVKKGDAFHYKRFTGWDLWEQKPCNDDYDLVYEGVEPKVDKGGKESVLAEVFYIFNMEHPSDYRGHSLSVSDVVELDSGEKWFCDDVGWKLISEEEWNETRG